MLDNGDARGKLKIKISAFLLLSNDAIEKYCNYPKRVQLQNNTKNQSCKITPKKEFNSILNEIIIESNQNICKIQSGPVT